MSPHPATVRNIAKNDWPTSVNGPAVIDGQSLAMHDGLRPAEPTTGNLDKFPGRHSSERLQ